MRYPRYALLVLAVVIVLALWSGPGMDTPTASAANLTVGLDMDPDLGTTGAYPGTLPEFEVCRDVDNVGDFFYIDAFILDAPALLAFTIDFRYTTGGKISIQESDVEMLMGTGLVNLSDPIPDTNGLFTSGALDTGIPDSGSAPLVRLKIQAIGAGVAEFKISERDLNSDGNPDEGVTLTDLAAAHPGDTDGDGFFDGPFTNKTATISIAQPDPDGDGLSDGCDNCPNNSNADQADMDGDGLGDVCDSDQDGDGVPDSSDNCPTVPNPSQDPQACADDDGDGVYNGLDNCPDDPNPGQENNDGDASGDACDDDDDNDSILDVDDNCQFAVNPGQENDIHPGTTEGDHCEDPDGDNYFDIEDNCPDDANSGQEDTDGDGVGDACDNCFSTPNADQTNTDVIVNPPGDIYGDACDVNDDNDFYLDTVDNCPLIPNNNQADMDGDGPGDPCDDDADGDGYKKVIEEFLGSSSTDLDVNKTPEVCDGVDNDGDTEVDEGWDFTRPNPPGGPPNGVPDCFEDVDTDGDGADNPNDDDDDNDGSPDTVENAVITDPFSDCAATSTPNDELLDAVPMDLNDDQRVGIGDVLSFIPIFNIVLGNPAYDRRYDMNADGVIGIADVLAAIPVFNTTCTP